MNEKNTNEDVSPFVSTNADDLYREVEIRQVLNQTRLEGAGIFNEFNKNNGGIYNEHDKDMFVAGYVHGVVGVAISDKQEEDFKNA